MTDEADIESRGVPRRHALQLLGLAGAGAAAAACTDTSGGKKGADTKAAGSFDIPASTSLPKGEVKLHWVDSGDSKADFFRAFFPVYSKMHKNVSVTYEGLSWNTIGQQVGLGLRNGTAPDVFSLPLNITAGQALANKWLHPVDDIVPNWAEVKKRFPAGIFANGVTDFGGKTYGVPFSGPRRIGSLLLVNKDYADKADVDLTSKPVTWQEFRDAAKKMTKNGSGKYYGIIFGLTQSGGLSGPVTAFCEMSGVHGGTANPDWRTGEYNFTNPIVADCVELLLALKSDGSVFPGSASLDQPGARQRFPQGVAGMIIQGAWNIGQWRKDSPDLKLDLNLPPLRSTDKIWPTVYGPGGSDTWWVSAKTKQNAVIGDIFNYLATDNGQQRWADFNGAGDPPALPTAIAKAKLDSLNAKALRFGTQNTAIGPQPAVRNPDVEKVFEAQKTPSPSFDDTLVGLFTGQLKGDVTKILKDVQDRYDKSLEDAIKLARSRGAKVSRDDWVFKDWDPSKPYTRLYQK